MFASPLTQFSANPMLAAGYAPTMQQAYSPAAYAPAGYGSPYAMVSPSAYAASPAAYGIDPYSGGMAGAYGGSDMLSVLGDLFGQLGGSPGPTAYAYPQMAMAAPATMPMAQPMVQPTAGAGTLEQAPVVAGVRRQGNETWAGLRNPRSVHVTQVQSKYNPNPAANNRDCGPASVLMAIRMLGLKLPGAVRSGAQAQIDRVRSLAGSAARTAETTNHDLENALRKVGAKARETFSQSEILQSVKNGMPVILNGNPRNQGSYGHGFSADKMLPYDGMHWITVSGFDNASGKFIINDPLSKIGPVSVTPSQLEGYRAGGMGIVVSR